MNNINEPVDAVITWVDGLDPAHVEKLAAHLEQLGIVDRSDAAEPTRFNQCGELDYCVQSILKFAPWIRRIYIVTDAQRPPILDTLAGSPDAERVVCVDHQAIFSGYEAYLPTFNSLSIENLLWRIDGLAERFIYFNDDCFLIRPVHYDDFFKDEQLVLRGEWKTQMDWKWWNRFKRFMGRFWSRFEEPPQIDSHRQFQEYSARIAGFERRLFHLPHIPFPLKKSLFEGLFARDPDRMIQNSFYSLRDPHQFWPISLVHHLALKTKTGVIESSLRAIAVNPACHSHSKIKARLLKAERDKRVAFVCFQSMDMAEPSERDYMFSWLNHHILAR